MNFAYSPNTVQFVKFRNDVFYYQVREKHSNDLYQFTVPYHETKGATFERDDNSSLYRRWIRACIDNNTMIKLADGADISSITLKEG